MSYDYLIKPRPEQIVAQKRIYKRKRLGLFWDMGTGKTKVVLDFVANLVHHKQLYRALVVAPLTVLGTWEEQIELNCPWIKYSFLTSEHEPNWSSNLILTNYDYFKPRAKKRMVLSRRTGLYEERGYIDKERLNSIIDWGPQLVALDESHKIKNPYSRAAKAAHKLGEKCYYAVLLTGTPIGNKPLDLWSQMKFLNPNLLQPDFGEFKKRYARMGGFGGFRVLGYQHLDELAKTISPYITKRKKNLSVEKQFIPFRIKMDQKTAQIYDKMEEEFITEVQGVEITAPIVLAKMIKLSQLTGGFIRSNDGKNLEVHTLKLDATEEIVEDLKASGVERIIIYARFIWEIEKLMERLKDWDLYPIHGDIPQGKRAQAVKDFTEKGGIIISQISTGSAGLNLQACNYTIFYSYSYSYIDFTQAQDRTHRGDQTKTCYYYLLKIQGTIDTQILGILRDKKNISDEVFNLIDQIKQNRTLQ